MIDMIPDGPVKVDASWESDLSNCCSPEDSSCGVTQTQVRSNSQSVTWKNAAEIGFSMKYNVGAGPAFKLGFGFSAQDTFTYGQTTTTKDTTTIQVKCTCGPGECADSGKVYFVDYKLKLLSLSQPVKIHAKMCGETRIVEGNVKAHQYSGDSQCIITGLESWAQCSAEDGGRRLLSNASLLV